MSSALSLFLRPTPVEVAPRLAGAIGLDPGRLLIKRDDLIGLGGGGNKVRKLEITIALALEQRAKVVVTTGAQQSNHARLTAAAAARCGLQSVLVLEGSAPTSRTGNLLLDDLLGAEIVFAGDHDTQSVAVEEAARRSAYLIPFGGSSPESAEAYRAAGQELVEQVPDVGTVVVAVGSGGTMAGLVAGLGADRVLGVATGAVMDAPSVVADLLRDMGESVAKLQIDNRQIGSGYAQLTPATRDAMLLTARTEGIVLDPTYTGRAMAGLIAAVNDGTLPDGPIVFLHTGGLPGLFGYSDVQR